ncbi:cytochrome C oxidase subunit IV [Mesorhizobium sp. Root157]|uniref:aa3-type cytochrome c oxidase subunit IV n=1 Tax=Mesorhizobium sp. Root157 TaxID=1736477 RepID=UPI0006FDEFFD|nr:aa3-type cytochrome c oxidase subunit IV [Mesorhizobium sp. Root157]KQZ93962.1 cytochrome C oxidase subunit IV [Mesorhizobium sp. Root157]
MADHTPTGPVELGAHMDYPEHERTYHGFTLLAKYGSLGCAATLIGMAFGFFVGGAISGFIVFLLACAVGAFILR